MHLTADFIFTWLVVVCQTTIKFDLSTLPPGNYYIKVMGSLLSPVEQRHPFFSLTLQGYGLRTGHRADRGRPPVLPVNSLWLHPSARLRIRGQAQTLRAQHEFLRRHKTNRIS